MAPGGHEFAYGLKNKNLKNLFVPNHLAYPLVCGMYYDLIDLHQVCSNHVRIVCPLLSEMTLPCCLNMSSSFGLSYMTHHSPCFGGKEAMEKMAIINKFGPVLINGHCIGYMLADHS